MGWNHTIKSSTLGEIFKIVSYFNDHERVEGLLHVSLNKLSDEVFIEALEVAPWNREFYLGNEREFRQLGLILIGYSIIYGFSHNFCGIIRLESLRVRENYYKNGLDMNKHLGTYYYTEEDSKEFLFYLEKNGLLRFGKED